MSTTTTLSGDTFHSLTIEKSLRSLTSAYESKLISKRDYDLILEFINLKRGFSNISIGRYRKLIFHLTTWRKYIGEYESNTIGDLAAGILNLQSSKTQKGVDFSPVTILDYIRILKLFYRWLIDEGHSDITEKQIGKIRMPKTKRSKYSEDDILSQDKIEKALSACKDLEELTIFSLLYEGALRIGEIGTLTWDDIDFHKTHVNLNVRFKTDFQRQIPIIVYKEYIQSWKNIKDPEPGKPVFLNRFKEPYKYAALRKKLRLIAERAELNTTLPPHLVRHIRITHMIQEGMPRETVGLICWGQINAKELDRYAHLFGTVDELALRHYGIVRSDDKPAMSLTPMQCPECGYINPPGKMFCFSCNKPLSDTASKEYAQFANNMTPDKMMSLITKIIESGHEKSNDKSNGKITD